MPNHCVNRLTICGCKKELEAFLKAFSHKQDGTMYYVYLQKFVKELTTAYQDLGGEVPDPSSMLDALWTPYGTKWGCYEFLEPVWSRDKVVLTFKTAWGPYNAMTQMFMSKQFPTLKFQLEYAECGQCFVGEYRAIRGQLIVDVTEEVYKTGKVSLKDMDDGTQKWVWKPGYEHYQDLWNMSG